MSKEYGMTPEGADFKAPEDKPKQKKGLFTGKFGKLVRGATAGMALFGGGVAMEQKAQAGDWADKVGKVTGAMTDMSRESNRHRERQAEINARIEEQRLRHIEQMQREALRLKQEELRMKQDQERENTQRQDQALRTVERTGAVDLETSTQGGTTRATVKKQGTTERERMQAEDNLSRKELEELRLQKEFQKNHPELQGKIQK
ncbi:MAG: hypothetical protein M1333_00260 [Patescibacteria group bacterium]|nr:hypothetical protein [Patescibacteria group bacterium]